MEDFSIGSQTLTANTAVTKLAGDMDAHAFDLLEDEFSKLLESGVNGVVLDLSGLDSMSSSAVGAVVNMDRLLAGRGGKLVAAAVRPKVMGLLEMLGLGETLTFADNAEAAKKIVSSIK